MSFESVSVSVCLFICGCGCMWMDGLMEVWIDVGSMYVLARFLMFESKRFSNY